MNSPALDFYWGAQDFLLLISKKAKQGSVNSEAAKEAEIMQNFFEISKALISRCETDLQKERMLAAVEHVKGKILEKEIREIYNELHKRNRMLLAEIYTTVKSVVPTKSELMEEVHIKNNVNGS